MILSRNDRCPCNSGRKVKRCCKDFLTIRTEHINGDFKVRNEYAEHQRNAKSGKSGYESLTYLEWLSREHKSTMQELSDSL